MKYDYHNDITTSDLLHWGRHISISSTILYARNPRLARSPKDILNYHPLQYHYHYCGFFGSFSLAK